MPARSIFGLLLCSAPSALLAVRSSTDELVLNDAVEDTSQSYVCCLAALEPNFQVKVFNPSRAQGDLKTCLLTSLIANCGTADACAEQCGTSMKGQRQYHSLLVAKAQEEAKALAADRDAVYADQDKAVAKAQASAEQDYAAALKQPTKDLSAAEKALDGKVAARDERKKSYDQAVEQADAAKKDFDAKAAAKQATDQQATAAKTTAVSAAQSASLAAKQAADAAVEAKAREITAKTEQVSSRTASPVPEDCQDPKSPTGAKDCCCSIGQVPMLVSGATFVQWGDCRGAKAFDKVSLFSILQSCSYLDRCEKCATIICDNGGKGVCP